LVFFLATDMRLLRERGALYGMLFPRQHFSE